MIDISQGTPTMSLHSSMHISYSSIYHLTVSLALESLALRAMVLLSFVFHHLFRMTSVLQRFNLDQGIM